MRTFLNKGAHEARARVALDRLRSRGMRITPQRVALVDAFVGDLSHPTAQALFERLRPAHPTMSFATVYNTLAALETSGVCRTVQFDGVTRFDPNVADHDHAVCSACGAIRDVPALRPHRSPRVRGFRVERVEHVIRGVCDACRPSSARA